MNIPQSPVTDGLSALPPRPLVGRARELEHLRALMERVQARREPAAVLLVGEPGVGKTRLLQTLSEWARSSGWSVSIGTAYPMTRGVPYAPLSEALDPLVRDLDPATISGMVRGALQELSSVLPSLASERAPNRADAGDELQPRVMWTVTRLLERLAARRPLLLAIDNLQWSDHATLELLHFAVRQAHAVPLVLIGAISDFTLLEDERLAAVAQSLGSLEHVTTVPVLPLALPDIEELIEHTFSTSRGTTRDFTTLLFGWTRGNVSSSRKPSRHSLPINVWFSAAASGRDGTSRSWSFRLPSVTRCCAASCGSPLTPALSRIGSHCSARAHGMVCSPLSVGCPLMRCSPRSMSCGASVWLGSSKRAEKSPTISLIP